MAVTTFTKGFHVQRAIDFVTNNEVYMAFGRTTPWENEEEPPNPVNTSTYIEEVLGYKLLDNLLIVKEDPVGAIQYPNSTWRAVPVENAHLEQAIHVYIECKLEFGELEMVDFRQIGVFTGLQKNEGVDPNKRLLLPEEVLSPGLMEVISNRRVEHRYSSEQKSYSFIITF